MGEQAVRSRRAPAGAGRTWWWVAFVAVPSVLAGLAMAWPGPQLAEDLRYRSEGALAAAGLTEVLVTLDGRDADLTGIPAGAERAALDAVGAVAGIRSVQMSGRSVPASDPVQPPAAPSELRERLGVLLGAAPVRFRADSAELAGPAAVTVRQVAELLVAEPVALIDVEGHVADTPGGAAAAQALSARRAQVVADALVAAGVQRRRITVRGVGAQAPLATPAASRRVEISVG